MTAFAPLLGLLEEVPDPRRGQGLMPRLRKAARFAAESQPLSVMAARGVMSGPMSSDVSSWVQSLVSPPVRWKAMGRPSKSVLRWVLHENPPRERPSA